MRRQPHTAGERDKHCTSFLDTIETGEPTSACILISTLHVANDSSPLIFVGVPRVSSASGARTPPAGWSRWQCQSPYKIFFRESWPLEAADVSQNRMVHLSPSSALGHVGSCRPRSRADSATLLSSK